jgi:hypothetical protein
MNEREKAIYRHLNTHPYYQTEAWYARLYRLQARYPVEFKRVAKQMLRDRDPGERL